MCGSSAVRSKGRGGSSMAMGDSCRGNGRGVKQRGKGLQWRDSTPTSRCRRFAAAGMYPQESPNVRAGTDPVRSRRPPGRVVHEGHAAVPDVRFFQSRGAGAQGGRRQRTAHGQRARGAGDPRQPAALFELADVPAALHPGGTDRVRRTGAHARRGAEGVSEAAGNPLAGRVVLITGAPGGLGSVAARACARAGATVVLLGRKVPKLNRLYDAIVAEGPEPLLYPLDLEGASPDDYAELAARIEPELGRLDGLLHCAAEFRGLTPLLHTDPAAFARAIHVNLTAPAWLTQACLPLLLRAPDAAVVFT